ncbi:MAG: TIGR02281 family clan AA aspartic protease [Sphingomicrobium sp.]
MMFAGTVIPQWQQLALYAVIAAVLLMLIQRIPVIGKLVRLAFSFALLAFCFYLLLQQAPFQPKLASIAGKLGLDRQQVVGKEVRIRLAPDGHFWANVSVGGVQRRMLIDSGATITAFSQATAKAAAIEPDDNLVPVVMQTANGVAQARTATVDELHVGNIVARNLKVVTAPGLGVDILGMNFLSKLKSWRVENNVLILVPNHPQPATDAT